MSIKIATVSDAHTLSQQRFNQAAKLEKQLWSVIQLKGPLDPKVQDLHCNIRENYETIIIEDHHYAEFHDVEQALWRVHYKQIEEFRIRIRKNMAAAAMNPMPASKTVSRKESVKMLLACFNSFLSEGTEFYHHLILKFREKPKLPKEVLLTEGVNFTNGEKGDTELKQCQISCHRCLIYLGDLARYKELHGDMDVRNRDWSVAADYYLKAIFLWPASGNPYNQLAVLATYIGDDLLAVYRYFRSLAVDNPFLTARDNLILLFEKNRQHYHQNFSAKDRMADFVKMTENEKTEVDKLAVKDNEQHSTEDNLKTLQIVGMRKSFCIYFVRLNGILFTKMSLETFSEVYVSTMRELENLLSLDDKSLEAGFGTYQHRNIGTGSNAAVGAVQLVCILIFTVHNIIFSKSLQQSSHDEGSEICTLLHHALTAAFECAAHLMHRCVESKDVLTSPLLSAMLVFMEWLACTPEIAKVSKMDEKQANAMEFFWRQSVMLLNKMQESVNSCAKVNTYAAASVVFNTHSGIETEKGCHIALWEDYELQGFVPLVTAQMPLTYSHSPPRLGMKEKKELIARVQRILAAGRTIVNVLHGTEIWIAYNEKEERFYLAEQLLERKKTEVRSSNKEVTAVVKVQDHHDVHVGLNNGLLPDVREQKYAGVTDRFAPETKKGRQVPEKQMPFNSDNVEEDGEDIVFKPIPKEITAHTSASGQSGDLYLGTSNKIFSKMPYTLPNKYTHDKLLISEGPNFLMLGINNEQSNTVSLPLEQWQYSSHNFPHFLWEAKIQSDQTAPGPTVPPGQAGNEFSTLAFSTMLTHSHMKNSLGMSSVGTISSVQEAEPQREFPTFKNTDSINYLKDWLSSIASLSSQFTSTSSTSWDLQNDDITVKGGMLANSAVIGEQKQEDLGNFMLNTEREALSLGGLSNLSMSGPSVSYHIGNNLGVSANSNMDFSSEVTNVEPQSISSTFLMDSFPTVPHLAEQYPGMPYPSAPLLPNDGLTSEPRTFASTQFLKCSGVDQGVNFDAGTKDLDVRFSMLHDYVTTRNGPSDLFISNVRKTNLGSCWMGVSSSGPPSGLGSLPLNSEKGRLHVSPKPLCQFPQTADMEDPYQVDISALFDGYTHSRLEPSNQRYHDGEFSLYSSDNESWSNASSLAASLEDRGFRFPGLGISQFYQTHEDKQRNLLLLQLSQQLLQEQQEAKRFGSDVELQTLQLESLQCLYEHHQSTSQ